MSTQEIQDLKESIKRTEAMTASMHTAIVGDKSMGIEGLVERVEHNERFRKYVQKGIWWGMGAASLVSFIFFTFKDNFKIK